MKRFTNSEKINGAFAAERLSSEAREYLRGSDCYSLYEYEKEVSTGKLDEDGYEIIDTVTLYAVNEFGEIRDGMTFEEVDNYLAECYRTLNEYTM